MASTCDRGRDPVCHGSKADRRDPGRCHSANHTAAPQLEGLSFELRGSCVVSTVTATGIPSITGPRLSLSRRASWDKRGWSRHDGVDAGSRCDGPVGGAAVLCREPEPLMPMVVKGGVAHRKLATTVDQDIPGAPCPRLPDILLGAALWRTRTTTGLASPSEFTSAQQLPEDRSPRVSWPHAMSATHGYPPRASATPRLRLRTRGFSRH